MARRFESTAKALRPAVSIAGSVEDIYSILLLKSGHINTIADSIGLQGDAAEILACFSALVKWGKSLF